VCAGVYVFNWLRGKGRRGAVLSHVAKGWKDDGWWRRMWPNAFRNYWIIKQAKDRRTKGPGFFHLLLLSESRWILRPTFLGGFAICLCTELLTWPKTPDGKTDDDGVKIEENLSRERQVEEVEKAKLKSWAALFLLFFLAFFKWNFLIFFLFFPP